MKYEPQGSVFGGYGFMNYAARRSSSHVPTPSSPAARGRLRQLADQLLLWLQQR